MIFREATTKDIHQIQAVRNAVKENVLSDPALVSDEDCIEFITHRGKGWVCETEERIVGFAIADLQINNVWALFIHPDFEGKGIGKKLQYMMLSWYFGTGKSDIWLGTAPGTKAERFYTQTGWRRNGKHGKNEVKFEMTQTEWENLLINM